jgi:hypothetical protein
LKTLDIEHIVINKQEILTFLKKAKQQTYACASNAPPRIHGCKEYTYQEGQWLYRDCYAGSLVDGGMELIWFNNKPIWMMSYYGGIIEPCDSNLQKANITSHEVFALLKNALFHCPPEMPIRGPQEFSQGQFVYKNMITGSISKFSGDESIAYDGIIIYEQKYIGGLLQDKHYHVSIL